MDKRTHELNAFLNEAKGISPDSMKDAEDEVQAYLDYAYKELSALSKKLAKKYHSIQANTVAVDRLLSDEQREYPNAYYNILTGRFR